jgi:hypothetical protein
VEGSIYLGSAAASLFYFVLAVRLIRLGIRTRSTPEWLLGLTFLAWMMSYAPWAIAIGLLGQFALEPQILIASRIATNLGGIGIAFFPLLVFRRGSTWAKRLSVSIATCLIVGTVGSSWVGDSGGVDPLSNAWWWFEWVGTIAPSIWIGTEGLNHYGTSRPRVRLGLCEPIVGHRYLLWGIAGAVWTLLDFLVIGEYVEFWATQSWSATFENLVGFCEIAALAMIWLAFFTPAGYQRWIDRRNPHPKAAGG